MTNQEKLEEAYERLSLYRNDNYEAMFPNNNDSDDWELIFNAIRELEIYKKALDKACEIHVHTCCKYDTPSLDEGQSGNITWVQEFKEYLLKESEKQ